MIFETFGNLHTFSARVERSSLFLFCFFGQVLPDFGAVVVILVRHFFGKTNSCKLFYLIFLIV